MEKWVNLNFNPKPPTIMHIDINSCFATIEQQANPHLRGKSIAVAAYTGPSGCIVAPSIEAKQKGIRVGMRVKDGKLIDQNLVILPPDPPKYRDVHLKTRTLLETYSGKVIPKSIDEFVMDLEGFPAFKKGMFEVGKEIKFKIRKIIGEWISVSIGIAPNRFLAKTASDLKKPNGLEKIDKSSYLDVYKNLDLMDLSGIKRANSARLGNAGIFSVLDFFRASGQDLRAAFGSVFGYYWYLRLRGWEIDDVTFGRKSFGNSFALPKPFYKLEDLAPILSKLVEKTGRRLRKSGYRARGMHVAVKYRDGTHWHLGRLVGRELFDSKDLYKEAFKILSLSPYKKPVSILAESCYGLVNSAMCQLDLLEDLAKKERLVNALDKINDKWGDFVITPARMVGATEYVPDRIAFGGIKELVKN